MPGIRELPYSIMHVMLADKGYLASRSRPRMCPPEIHLTVLGERVAEVRGRYVISPRLSMSVALRFSIDQLFSYIA